MIGPRKLEKARSNDKNQTHLNLIQMGLDQDEVLGVAKNVEKFRRAPKKGKRIIGKARESKLE